MFAPGAVQGEVITTPTNYVVDYKKNEFNGSVSELRSNIPTLTTREILVSSLKRATIVTCVSTAFGLAGVGAGGVVTAATGGTASQVGLALATGGIAVAIAAPLVFVISFVFFAIVLGIQAHRAKLHEAAAEAKVKPLNEEPSTNKTQAEEQQQTTLPVDSIEQPQQEPQPTLSLFDQMAMAMGVITVPHAAAQLKVQQ